MVKKLTKLIALVALLFSYLVPVAQVVSADEQQQPKATSLTIHKIKLDNLDKWKDKTPEKDGTYLGTDNTRYDGTKIQDIQKYFDQSAEELDGVSFYFWKIEEKQYKEMVKAPGKYATIKDVEDFLGEKAKDTYEETAPTEGKKGVFVGDLEAGYYWFIENTGSALENGYTVLDAVAVPFGLALPTYKNNGDQITDLHVYPKNTVTKPEIDKNFGQGTPDAKFKNGAEYNNYQEEKGRISRTVGEEIPYHVKTKIPKGTRYQTVRWEDTMTSGLTLLPNVLLTARKNNDPVDFIDKEDYTIKINESGFVIVFTKEGLNKLEKEAKDGDIEFDLTYKAKLNTSAIVDQPENNQIFFDYSNNPKEFKDPFETPVKPSNKEIKVNKTWAEGTVPDGVTVTYFLYEKGQDAAKNKVVASVEKKGPDYSHTFKGLDDSKDYYVKETVKGYSPEYIVNTDEHTVSIVNTKDEENPEPLVPTSPKVVTGGARFQKVDQGTSKGLAGAEFYIKNQIGQYLARKSDEEKAIEQKVYDEAEKTYQDLVRNTTTADYDQKKGQIEQAKQMRDEAYRTVKTEWKFVAAGEKGKAYVVTSGDNGYFHVTGLAYDKYNLEEKTAPEGYAKLSEDVPFEVKEGSMADVKIDTKPAVDPNLKLVNNKKVTIPQTGGIGTAIFTAAGLAIMGFAFVAMKRKKA